ncbi:MAG TPA: NUDIX domain-containing protein [Acidothermaceae bacterium]|nr:NUDIX domain-containing protein [Acidothermaceae bacterium]
MADVAAVGAIAISEGCLLLIQRGHAPSRGRWSLPGGRVEAGETAEAALVREVAEETGLVVEVGALVGEVRRAGPAGVTYRIQDFLVTVSGAAGGRQAGPVEPVPGDDALQAAWVPIDEVSGYRLSAGLLRTLRAWAVIPRKA